MSENILVVDDEQVIRDLTSMVLTPKGYMVEAVSSGAAALERADAINPALILLDYMMPEMDGLTVLKKLREKLPDSYVVMFTGKGSEELAVELMKAGASDYLRKPFNNQDLVDRIENVLRIRRIEIRNRELLEEREQLLQEIAGWNCELEQRVAEKSRELEQAQSEIIQVEKLGALGQLSAGLAHEIRNPLNSISLFSQVLKQRLDANAELHDFSDKIMKEVEKIDELLIRLLRVSEHSLSEREDVDLNKTIRMVVSDFDSQLELQNVRTELTLASQVPPLRANAEDIEQVFSNLFANALQAMPDGGKVFVTLNYDDQATYIRFADTGSGIPKENLSRIFDPFFTTKTRGTGFGLSSVLRVIKNYDGRISAGNGSEGGAVFDIEFPRTSSQDI